MPSRINITDAEIQAALEHFGGIVGFAARYLGMSPRTLSRRISRNPDLCLTQYHIQQGILDHALGAVIARVRAGDFKAIRWWLNRFGADLGYGRSRKPCDVVDPVEAARLYQAFAKIFPELLEEDEEDESFAL